MPGRVQGEQDLATMAGTGEDSLPLATDEGDGKVAESQDPVDQLAGGLVALVEPAVREIDGNVRRVQASQRKLRGAIDAVAAGR